MKKILLILIVLGCMPAVSLGYMEAKLFCSINEQEIRVSTKGTSTCQAYILYIEQTMRQTARELYTLQDYINKGQDVDYWTQVKKEKLAYIDKLQGVRLNVIASMKAFEFSLLKKSVDYFILRVTPYKLQLTKSLTKLTALTGIQPPEVTRLISLMSGQVQTIDKIAAVRTFEELIPLLNGYIYFQRQIAGKSE